MSDWQYAQINPSEELAQLHFFSVKKLEPQGPVQFRITIKEFASPPPGQFVRFFAEADKPVNQNTAPIVPSGWGESLFKALADCLRIMRQFPYEGKDGSASSGG